MATELFFPAAREAYERGMSVRRLKARFHLSDSELEDIAPEEFPKDDARPEGPGGY